MLADMGILLDNDIFKKYHPGKIDEETTKDAGEYRASILERYESTPEPVEKVLLLGGAFHGTWVGRELLKDIKPEDIFLNTVNNIEIQKRAKTGSVIKSKSPAKPLTRAELEAKARFYVSELDRTIGNVTPSPELYISSIVPALSGATSEDREFERELFAKLFTNLFDNYKKTLFVFGSSNEGCHIKDTKDNYAWSGITSRNLAVVGSCDEHGNREDYSAYGPNVNENFYGRIRISTDEIYGKMPSVNVSATVSGTSYATPKFARAILKKRLDNREKFPDKTVLDYFLEPTQETASKHKAASQ